MAAYRTEQEKFWAETFGDGYVDRNCDPLHLARLLPFWAQVLRGTGPLGSVLELGANIGLNLRALDALVPGMDLHGVEINGRAAELLKEWGRAEVHALSILDFRPQRTWDLVFTRGVLIHLNPQVLGGVYDLMASASAKYVLMAEYYNPCPVEIPYRGQEGFLFKRDFAGEFLEVHQEYRLVDYGFVYHRDVLFPQDDINWFLMERKER
ncbi:pseudaminic acid biosynthesis-associated methylase [Aminomonas paucivorans DSM 12260]|uniref:Pseudaminic acid biosynthesis-associated methylase n=1 Tax=Aminomonas paucivorans DSM 12260 TaxID=584708 RepID=E3CXE3_9BACT|nr:pseudaminic acid biosynthesis-associated methylase [Aminomonas paucivorans]EFQ23509.1 pseudaminic acid biosynthesis-associated methylase [Aminomonas paucivorans DSM 12260]